MLKKSNPAPTGNRPAPTPNPPRPPIDGCTESHCPCCRTNPAHRGDMEHAGIGDRPSAVEASAMNGVDELALDMARRFTLDNEVQCRAQLQVAFAEAMAIGKDMARRGMFRAGFRSGMAVSAASQAGKLPLPGEAREYTVSHVSPMNFGGFCAQIITPTKIEPGTKLFTVPPEFKVMAYQEVKPTDDPDVFDAKIWSLGPGMKVPDGCTPLYWRVGENVPHYTNLNGDNCFTSEDLARAFAGWNKRANQPTDWRNELLTLAEHHGPIPAFAREAMRTIAKSMPEPIPAEPVEVIRDDDGEIVMVKKGDKIIASTCHAGGKRPAASDDRGALLYLMSRFEAEAWNCPKCGHAEDTATMDSADYLRRYLAESPAADPVAAAQEAVLRIYAEGDMRVVTEWLDGSRDLPDGDHRLYAAPVTAAPYSLDADPQGIRERVAAAISGALAFGSQGNNAPPAGHWLQQFWDIGRAEAELRAPGAPGINAALLKDPATLHAMMLRGTVAIPSWRCIVDLRGEVQNTEDGLLARIAELQEKLAEANTPAAPGIDHAILARDIHHAIADAGLAPLSPTDNHTLREVIRSVIDTSPKGEDSIASAFDRAVLEPMRREAKADSPKGGSEAPTDGEVLVTVSGLTGSGKSAVAGEIEILCKALGLEVEWADSEEEKRLTHADWTEALELYKPRVRIVEVNIPRAQASDAEVRHG